MSNTLQPILDHVVINVLGQLDEASDIWRRLGFQLTERGHHSMGTSNHLSIFGENYLELLGYEPGNENKRPDIVNAPKGLTGLVFKTDDSAGLYEHIQDVGLRAETPAEFHRPVALAEGTFDARFRTVRLGAELVKNGRTFFCHHFTPELVWRDEWRKHPNGVTDIVEFVVASHDPAGTAALYQRLFGPSLILEPIDGGVAFQAGRASVRFILPDTARQGFGPVETTHDGSERMVALTLRTDSLARTRGVLTEHAIPFVSEPDGALLVHAADACRVALRFVDDAAK